MELTRSKDKKIELLFQILGQVVEAVVEEARELALLEARPQIVRTRRQGQPPRTEHRWVRNDPTRRRD